MNSIVPQYIPMLDRHVGDVMVSIINIDNDLKELTYTRRSCQTTRENLISMVEDSRIEEQVFLS